MRRALGIVVAVIFVIAIVLILQTMASNPESGLAPQGAQAQDDGPIVVETEGGRQYALLDGDEVDVYTNYRDGERVWVQIDGGRFGWIDEDLLDRLDVNEHRGTPATEPEGSEQGSRDDDDEQDDRDPFNGDDVIERGDERDDFDRTEDDGGDGRLPLAPVIHDQNVITSGQIDWDENMRIADFREDVGLSQVPVLYAQSGKPNTLEWDLSVQDGTMMVVGGFNISFEIDDEEYTFTDGYYTVFPEGMDIDNLLIQDGFALIADEDDAEEELCYRLAQVVAHQRDSWDPWAMATVDMPQDWECVGVYTVPVDEGPSGELIERDVELDSSERAEGGNADSRVWPFRS